MSRVTATSSAAASRAGSGADWAWARSTAAGFVAAAAGCLTGSWLRAAIVTITAPMAATTTSRNHRRRGGWRCARGGVRGRRALPRRGDCVVLRRGDALDALRARPAACRAGAREPAVRGAVIVGGGKRRTDTSGSGWYPGTGARSITATDRGSPGRARRTTRDGRKRRAGLRGVRLEG